MSEPNTPPIRAYIENAHNDAIGGFTIPLPTTKGALRPWLEAIEADGLREPREKESVIAKLREAKNNPAPPKEEEARQKKPREPEI